MNKGKVLVLLSAADAIPLREGGSHRTGIFLGELTKPAAAMIAAGYELVFASPGGRKPAIDPDSYSSMYWMFSSLSRAENVYVDLVKRGLETPLALEEIANDNAKLNEFVGLFVPGGHGPIVDLYHRDAFAGDELNQDVGAIITFFHQTGRPTGLICHAVALLAIPKDQNGQWLYQGYRMTVITRLSEWMNEDLPGIRVVNGHLKEYPVDILRLKGANLTLLNAPMIPYVVEDRELITGQDPFAAGLMGKKLVRKLDTFVNKRKF